MIQPRKYRKEITMSRFIAFILRQVENVLFWTFDPEEAVIIEAVASFIEEAGF